MIRQVNHRMKRSTVEQSLHTKTRQTDEERQTDKQTDTDLICDIHNFTFNYLTNQIGPQKCINRESKV